MSVLGKENIISLSRGHRMIEDWEPSCVRSASYDLRVGDHYYMGDGEDKGLDIKGLTNASPVITIPPNAVCYVISRERLNMPDNNL